MFGTIVLALTAISSFLLASKYIPPYMEKSIGPKFVGLPTAKVGIGLSAAAAVGVTLAAGMLMK